MVVADAAHVTGVVIKLAVTEGSVTTTMIEREIDIENSEQLIDEVLQQLESDGWIEQQSNPLPSWKTGHLARQYGNMAKYRQDMEGIIPVLPDER